MRSTPGRSTVERVERGARLLHDLDGFYTEHRSCGDLEGGVEDLSRTSCVAWMECSCGARNRAPCNGGGRTAVPAAVAVDARGRRRRAALRAVLPAALPLLTDQRDVAREGQRMRARAASAQPATDLQRPRLRLIVGGAAPRPATTRAERRVHRERVGLRIVGGPRESASAKEEEPR